MLDLIGELRKNRRIYLDKDVYLLGDILEYIESRTQDFNIQIELYLSIDYSIPVLVHVGNLRTIHEVIPLSLIESCVDSIQLLYNGKLAIYVHI